MSYNYKQKPPVQGQYNGKPITRGCAVLLMAVLSTTQHGQVYAQNEEGDEAAIEQVIEEVVVTAQHREQNVQEVGISIQAFSGDELALLRVQTAKDLSRVTTGLFMNESPLNQTDPEFTLRGVGTNAGTSNQNPATSLYVGGVSVPYNAMVGHALFDLERVEVLKGPQGTLYGRNTTGGAINFVPQAPGSEWGGYFNASYGNRNITNLEGAVDVPLSETFKLRFAGVVALEDGWQTLDTTGFFVNSRSAIKRRNGDVERQAIRVSALWEPTSNVEVLTTFDAGWNNSQVIAMEHFGNALRSNPRALCSFPLTGVRDEANCASFAYDSSTATLIPVTLGGRNFTVQDPNNRGTFVIVSDQNTGPRTSIKDFGIDNDIDAEATGITNLINWSLDRVVVTSVTGYRTFERTTGIGQQGGPFKTIGGSSAQDIDVVTQEVRIASDDSWGSFNWQVGGYFSNEDVNDVLIADLSEHHLFSEVLLWGFNQETETFAGFGQIEWDLSEQWQLIGGLRYTSEDRAFDAFGETVGYGLVIFPSYSNEVDGSKLTWKTGINYRPSDDWLVYGSIATGFRGQGFPASIAFSANQLIPFDEETITAYEVGFKSTVFNGKLQWNTALYYYDFENFQASAGIDRAGIRLIVLTNAGDVKVNGVESEIVFVPNAQWMFRLGVNVMKSEIISGDYDGDRTARSPDFSMTGLARYDSPKSFGPFTPFAQVDFNYNSKVQFQLPNRPGSQQNSYGIVNALFGAALSGQWEAYLWVQNIADKLYRTEAFGPGSTFLPAGILYGAPRTYGASVSYKF
ncbi:MAG: TonB-dependent receptor [Xanthomonadales bacterium]|nr:TonB-dependent receptor [Xanthomonadales bacterium]